MKNYVHAPLFGEKPGYTHETASRKFMILALVFFSLSFLGFVLETVCFRVWYGGLYDRGFLTLPFCPLYGFSMVGIFLAIGSPTAGLWRKFYSFPKSLLARAALIALTFLIYSVLAAILATIVEHITGVFFFNKYGVRLWDYRGYSRTFGEFAQLDYSICWGALASVGMATIFSPLQNALTRLSSKTLFIAVIILTLLMAADFGFNILFLSAYGFHFAPYGL